MRTTITALLCSITVAACAPVGERGDDDFSPDAGTGDGGAAGGVCDAEVVKTMDITLSGAASFSNLPTKCWRLHGKLTISGAGVASLGALGDLRGVRDLVIDDSALVKFDTKSPVEVSGSVTVRYNDKLTDLTNLGVASTVQSITVEYNPELTALGGIAKANIVAGETRITNNAKLQAVNLGTASRLEGGLLVQDNPALTSLDLHTLQSVANLTIRNNAALTSLGALDTLEFVHGSITIDNNDNLVSLANTMTNGVKRVDIGVIVTGNAKLNDLGGLAQIKWVELGVQITSNPALTYCEVREIDCCVDSGTVSHSGNQTTTCNQDGYSWCVQQLGYCPYM